MNQNRSCPGVPNRYRISSGLIVIRPKSNATVVVVFASTPERSSTPSDAEVSISSVRNGGTSLTEPTMVVLPTPKPPAISSCTAVAVRRRSLEFADAIENRLQYVLVGCFAQGCGLTEDHIVLLDQITEQNLHQRQGEIDVTSDLRDGHRPLAQTHDPRILGGKVRGLLGRTQCHDQRHHVEAVVVRSGPAARHHVRAHQTRAALLEPRLLVVAADVAETVAIVVSHGVV